MESYDFETKHLYRQRRESAIDKINSSGKFRDRKVAYLDTAEALDTIAYLKRGYRPQNLWAVNKNPAEVARLTSKLKTLRLPTVNTVGLDFEDALARRVPEVDIIDFDGMSCLHDDLVMMLRRIVKTRPMASYGVTILGGREAKESKIFAGCYGVGKLGKAIIKDFPDLMDNNIVSYLNKSEKIKVQTSFGTEVNPMHARRIRDLLNAISYDDRCVVHINRVLWDVYISTSNQPMVWCVIKTTPHKQISTSAAVNLRNLSEGYATPFCKINEVMDIRSAYVYKHGQGYIKKELLDDLDDVIARTH